MTITILKPCPFCGGKPRLDDEQITCLECNAEMPIEVYVRAKVSKGGYPTYEEAKQRMIDCWNRRTQ